MKMMTKTQLQWLVVMLQRKSFWGLGLVHTYIQQKLRKLMICSIITIINILMNSINYKKYCCCSSHLVCILYDHFLQGIVQASVMYWVFPYRVNMIDGWGGGGLCSIVVFSVSGQVSTFLQGIPNYNWLFQNYPSLSLIMIHPKYCLRVLFPVLTHDCEDLMITKFISLRFSVMSQHYRIA